MNTAVTRHLFLLAGQSNMDGMGWNSELPHELNRPLPDVPVYQPNKVNDGQKPDRLGNWSSLVPGHGEGFRVTRRGVKPGLRFGPELSFAHRLRQQAPGQSIALFKYARGGSSLSPDAPVDWGCWDPASANRGQNNQWSHFERHYKRALDPAIRSSFEIRDELLPTAFLWLQGETDASYGERIAREYRQNLTRLVQSVRALTEIADLPVLICKISDPGIVDGERVMPWAPLVQQAQSELAASDPNVYLVQPPDRHGWQDPWHYDSQTYLETGTRLADAITRFIPGFKRI